MNIERKVQFLEQDFGGLTKVKKNINYFLNLEKGMDGTLNFLNLEEKSGKATPFPILFNLGFEILAEKIGTNNSIQGIIVQKNEIN